VALSIVTGVADPQAHFVSPGTDTPAGLMESQGRQHHRIPLAPWDQLWKIELAVHTGLRLIQARATSNESARLLHVSQSTVVLIFAGKRQVDLVRVGRE
jgi:hypothetical protein